MKPVCLRSIALIAFFTVAVGYSQAQTISFAFSGSGTSSQTSVINGTGTGTLTPGGAATVTITGQGSNDNCNNNAQFNFKVQGASAADSLTLFYGFSLPSSLSATNPSFTVTSAATVTAGTGIYSGLGGTGSGTLKVLLSSQTAFTYTFTASITLGGPVVPFASVTPSGIVPVYSDITSVQPGSWISVYGSNLGAGASTWNGDFPTTLGNTSVTIDGKNAYLWYVGPTQINAQVPDDAKTGCVPVVVSSQFGQATTQVDLENAAPSFNLLDNQYVAAEIFNPNGAYGTGANAYDLVGPVGKFSFKTRPVKRGETVTLYGTGFGPGKTPVAAGKIPSASVPTALPVQVFLGTKLQGNFIPAQVTYSGIIGPGLYLINAIIPLNAPTGDLIIQASVGATGPNVQGFGTTNDLPILLSVQ